MTSVTNWDDSKNFATAMAFFWCCSMRTWRVLRPRLARKQSNADGTAPIAFWRKRSLVWISGLLVTATPMTASECPLMYFVTEW